MVSSSSVVVGHLGGGFRRRRKRHARWRAHVFAVDEIVQVHEVRLLGLGLLRGLAQLRDAACRFLRGCFRKTVCPFPQGIAIIISFLARHSREKNNTQHLFNFNLPVCLHLPTIGLQRLGHHSPSQVLHALLVGQGQLGLSKVLPDLGSQRVLFLHLVWALGHASQAVLKRRESRGAE